MFFSTEKHKTIRKELAENGGDTKISTTEVAKMVSRAWKALSDEEREVWEEMARKDRARYEMEKAVYSGPWKVPADEKLPKDPTAPKRPMSAFLSFSNAKRTAVKDKHPTMNNAELSRLLARMWKDTPENEKAEYVNQEFRLRQEYKLAMTKWRRDSEQEENVARKMRQDMAMKAVLDGTHLGFENNLRDDSQCSSSIQHQYSDPALSPLPHGSYSSPLPAHYDPIHGNGAAADINHNPHNMQGQPHPYPYEPHHFAQGYAYNYDPSAMGTGYDYYGYRPQNYAVSHPSMAPGDPTGQYLYPGDQGQPMSWPPGGPCQPEPYPHPSHEVPVCHPPPHHHYGAPYFDPSAVPPEKLGSSHPFEGLGTLGDAT